MMSLLPDCIFAVLNLGESKKVITEVIIKTHFDFSLENNRNIPSEIKYIIRYARNEKRNAFSFTGILYNLI